MSLRARFAARRPAPRALLAMSGFMPVVDGLELDLDRPGLEVVDEHGGRRPRDRRRFAREARARSRARRSQLPLPRVHEPPLGRPGRPRTAARSRHETPRSPEAWIRLAACCGGPSPDPGSTRSRRAPSPPSSTRICPAADGADPAASRGGRRRPRAPGGVVRALDASRRLGRPASRRLPFPVQTTSRGAGAVLLADGRRRRVLVTVKGVSGAARPPGLGCASVPGPRASPTAAPRTGPVPRRRG